jgi:adenylate kinase
MVIAKTRPIIIVVLGHPGSGKGTFAQSLKDKNFIHLSIGDFLRKELQNKTDIGLRWIEEIKTFGILPANVMKEVTISLIDKINSEKPQIFILDGHVRTLEQAKQLDEMLEKNKKIYALFIYINVDKNEALQRILNRKTCGKCNYIYNLKSFSPKIDGVCDFCEGTLVHRNTDNIKDAKNRIDIYEPHLYETIEYYRNKHVLIEFNGKLPIQDCINQYREFFQ